MEHNRRPTRYRLVVQLILALFAVALGSLAGLTLASNEPLGLLLALPALLTAALFAAAYGICVYRERSYRLRAIYRVAPERVLAQLAFCLTVVVWLAPWALTAIKTPAIWAGAQHHSLTGAIFLQVVVILLPLAGNLIAWLGGESGFGWGGGGSNGDPDGPPEPSWWPDFERQFRRYAGQQRQPVSF